MTNDESSGVVSVTEAADDSLRGRLAGSLQFRHWHGFTTAMLDLLYTRKCEGCDAFLESGRTGVRRWLCDTCDLGMTRIVAPFCGVCGEPYDGSMTGSFR